MKEEDLQIEVVTHCYRYATLLRHQLSSLVLRPPPPRVHVTATVFHTLEDGPTTQALEWFGNLTAPQVSWNWQPLPTAELCRRSIGRNRAALASRARWVWFCDADYWFTSECWQAFLQLNSITTPLIFPRWVQGHRAHELGDQCIEKARGMEGLVCVDASEFEPERMKRAIGGIQIVSGEHCREHGYLKDSRRAQQPRGEWRRAVEDVWFRTSIGADSQAVEIPGVYRIRHSQAGRFVPGLVL